MKAPELLIVLDSNVLYRHHPMASLKVKQVMYTMTLINAWLQVPAVVAAEYANNYRGQVLKCKDSLCADIKEARKIGLKIKFPSERALERATGTAIATFSALIQREWGRRRVRFHPYPKVDHEQVVLRCLAGKRPFRPRASDEKSHDDKEKGYRDFLLWASLCEIYRATSSDIAFVTCDREAFWDRDRKGLHPDLLADLGGDPHGRVRLFDSIDAFLKTYYFPNLERQRDLEQKIAAGFRGALDFESIVIKSIEEVLRDHYEEQACEVGSVALGALKPKRVLLMGLNSCVIQGECWARFEVVPNHQAPTREPIRKRAKFEWDLISDLELSKSTQRAVSFTERDLEL